MSQAMRSEPTSPGRYAIPIIRHSINIVLIFDTVFSTCLD